MLPLSRGALLCAPAASAIFAFALAQPASAAPGEIEVYGGELLTPGRLGLELHNNYVIKGDDRPAHAGAQPSAGAYRLTPEFAYGLAPNVEIGVLALGTLDRRGTAAVGGLAARIRVLDHPGDRAWFWGANLEIARTARRFEATPWTAEVRGIWGAAVGRWELSINPILSWDMRGNEPAEADLASKVSYRLGRRFALGLESYNAFGPVRRFARLGDEPQLLYVAADIDLGRLGVNAGLGRGLTRSADGWVAKTVISVPLR